MKKKQPSYTTGEKSLSRKEAESVIMAADSFEDKILVMIGFSLGPRREDLVGIELMNIDLNAGELSYLEKKKGNRIKTVPLSDRLIQDLKLYLQAHTVPGQKYLFPALQKTHHCEHMSSKTAYNRFNKLCKKVGIKTPIPVHVMRATCIKLKRDDGWTVEQVAALIGDKVITVQEHYATPSRGDLAQLMKEKSGSL